MREDDVHTWQAATCSTPMTCSVCGETKGEAGGDHVFRHGNCIYGDARDGGTYTVSYTHLDVYKRQTHIFMIMKNMIM